MMSSHARPLAALLAAGALACGAPLGAQGHTHTHGAPLPPSSGTITNAAHPWTEADARFMSMMIGHHAQAVEMSRLAPANGSNPAVLRLAERIINAQEDEIAAMQLWLRDRGQPVPEPGDAAAMHHGAGEHAAGQHAGGLQAGGLAAMPGMLTDAQMAQLRAARGAEFDRLFLAYMIQHHRGAVSMVQQLFGSHGAAQDETVFKFASDVSVDQTTEIARMQRMLADLTFGSP
ncbi:MAG TPA: DUF305 domain-containing protein [Longimicrobium sp.]|nr:DUF305 domain-containing protein [Longimicrobium sp.]